MFRANRSAVRGNHIILEIRNRMKTQLRNRSAYALVGALLLIASALQAGEPMVLAPGKGRVVVYGGTGNTQHYYDLRGNLKKFDTLHTEFVATSFGINGSYGLAPDVQLDVDIPVGYFSLTSDERFPKRSIFAPTYVGVGATYQIGHGNLSGSVSTMLKLPPGFHNGIYDDPKHPSFLSDGYMQLTTTLNFGMKSKEVWFKGMAGYNWRDEEPADEIVYRAEVGFSKVEGTGVFVSANGVVSMADVQNPMQPFYAGASGTTEELARVDGGRGLFRTIDRENYFAINAGAFVAFSDRVFLSGTYSIRLFGTNSLAMRGVYLATGYNF